QPDLGVETGQVRCPPHRAARMVDDTGRADADSCGGAPAPEVGDDARDRVDDPVEPRGHGRLALGLGLDLLAVEDDPEDLGAPQVDADPGPRTLRHAVNLTHPSGTTRCRPEAGAAPGACGQ